MAFALLDDTIDEILTGTFREKDRQINFAIEELEKIKAEISKLTRYYTTESGNINLVRDNAVYRIINKHIFRTERNEE